MLNSYRHTSILLLNGWNISVRSEIEKNKYEGFITTSPKIVYCDKGKNSQRMHPGPIYLRQFWNLKMWKSHKTSTSFTFLVALRGDQNRKLETYSKVFKPLVQMWQLFINVVWKYCFVPKTLTNFVIVETSWKVKQKVFWLIS